MAHYDRQKPGSKLAVKSTSQRMSLIHVLTSIYYGLQDTEKARATRLTREINSQKQMRAINYLYLAAPRHKASQHTRDMYYQIREGYGKLLFESAYRDRNGRGPTPYSQLMGQI